MRRVGEGGVSSGSHLDQHWLHPLSPVLTLGWAPSLLPRPCNESLHPRLSQWPV